MMARPVQPRGVRRSATRPRDDRDLNTIARFLKDTGHPMTPEGVRRLVHLYELPRWPSRLNPRAHAYSLSDVLTAHAVEAAKGNPSDCAAAADKPACSGLADAFFSENTMGKIKVREAKELCAGCPFREPCLDTALADRDELQHGVRGGLSSKERRELKTKLMPPRDRSKCLQGHELSGDNLRIRPDTNGRVCRECARAQRRKSRRKQKR
jgi:WhiB family redox-sensing transcriptional regulator